MNPVPPLVVVGCGVAGLSVALAATPRPVVLVGRSPAGHDCATALAQGGIAAALDAGDSPTAHARDTLAAGAGHNDAAAVHYLTRQAGAAVEWLQAQGVAFDRLGMRLLLGREGGHGHDRIVHCGGDASGAALLAALERAVTAAAHIDWRPPSALAAIQLRDDRVAGIRTIAGTGGRSEEIACADLVLATGGCGALFAATTNPPGADGNGLAIAMAAGAAMRDLEFMQFHPTALDVASQGALPLVTEALRGAGARLLDGSGQALMAGVHPHGDLAPRDIVARQVWRCQQAGRQVWLDATGVQGDWQARFPTVLGICRGHGIDPRVQPIPVTPAAHFHMGGIAVDAGGRSSVRGLHAVGEVACNGVHGANRLASNSLLEGVVFGRRLGQRLADSRLPPSTARASRWVDRGAEAGQDAMPRLRALLWHALGPVRAAGTMTAAMAALGSDDALSHTWQGKLAAHLLRAALRRPGSLGAHYRSDDPVGA